jgi:hypothetical protein
MDDARREVLLKEYGEVASNFRTLTDIRFRMLSFLPVISGLVAAGVAIKGDLAGVGTFTLALLGLAATIGLATYNARNDQLYDALVGRAANLERALGLPDGQFANRTRPWLTIKIARLPLAINHGTAIAIIYAASFALWLTLLFAGLLELGRRTYVYFNLPHLRVSDPSAWVNAIALVLAIGMTARGAFLIEKQSTERRKQLRALAASAYKKALCRDLHEVLNDGDFIKICAELAGDKDMKKTQRRAQFYARVDQGSLSHYMLLGSQELRAAHLVCQGRVIRDQCGGVKVDQGNS